MKTNGALFLTALQNKPRLTSCQLAHDALSQWAKDAYDRVATAYDTARAALPEDVEAFVAEREASIRRLMGMMSTLPICSQIEAKFIAIVREQGARIVGLTEDNSRLWQHAIDCQKERDELREKLAKLEPLADAVIHGFDATTQDCGGPLLAAIADLRFRNPPTANTAEDGHDSDG